MSKLSALIMERLRKNLRDLHPLRRNTVYVSESKKCTTGLLFLSSISTYDLIVPKTLVRFKEANKFSIIPVRVTRNN